MTESKSLDRLPPRSSEEYSDRELDAWIATMDERGLQPAADRQAPFDIEEPLPPVLVQQRNGDFLSKTEHDKNLLDRACDEERDPLNQIVLMLNSRGDSYHQPTTVKKVLEDKKNNIGKAKIDRVFQNEGLLPGLADREQAIEHLTMMRDPNNSNRFVEAGKLRREQPGALVMARSIFVQNGHLTRNFREELYGNFTGILHRLQARPEHKRPLLPAQSNLLDELKQATAEALADPDFAWPSDITDHERQDLVRLSKLGTLDIPDNLLGRIPLRLTFRTRSREADRERPPESSDDELPYEIPGALEVSTPVNIDGRKRRLDRFPDILLKKARTEENSPVITNGTLIDPVVSPRRALLESARGKKDGNEL